MCIRMRQALPTVVWKMGELNEQWMTTVVDALSDLQAASVVDNDQAHQG